MLQLHELHAHYGASHVLRGVSLCVRPGEIVALLGRNGSGRSTLARATMGLLPWQGQLLWQGRSLAGLASHQIARRGLGYVPEGREVFANLSVQHNLLLGQKSAGASLALHEAYALFPALQARAQVAAGRLSGGEQQMLALARTLMGRPQCLLVDEPTEGLAPAVVAQVAACLQAQRAAGVAVLLIEQKRPLALALADRVLLMGQGRIVFEGSPAALQAQPQLQQQWLGV